MSDPLIPDPTPGLCHAESKSLIEAAQRVVRTVRVDPSMDLQCRQQKALDHLAEVLRHVTPGPVHAGH